MVALLVKHVPRTLYIVSSDPIQHSSVFFLLLTVLGVLHYYSKHIYKQQITHITTHYIVHERAAYFGPGNLGIMLKHSVITEDTSTSSVVVVIFEMWYMNVHSSSHSFVICSSSITV